MGCYGLGVSRIIASAADVMSTADELRWPRIIAPYQICIIPPKVCHDEKQYFFSCGYYSQSGN